MAILEPGVPVFCLEFTYLFVRCNPLVCADALQRSFGYELVGEGVGAQQAQALGKTLRLVEFARSEWTVIVPVDSIEGCAYIENANLLVELSRCLNTDSVFLANSDTAVVLIYRHAHNGEIVAELTYGEDEESDEVEFAPSTYPDRESALRDPYAFVDNAIREHGIILPLITQREKLGDVLLPVRELVQEPEEIATVHILQYQVDAPTN